MKAKSGGTRVILGEGGKDEMVVPLEASGDLGPSVDISSAAKNLKLNTGFYPLQQSGRAVARQR